MALTGYYHNELARVDKASQRLREVMDGLSSAFFIGTMTLEGIVTYANKTALEAVGVERKDVLGRLFVETPWWTYSEVTRQKLRDAITRAAKGESSRFDVIFENVHGELITADFSLHPVLDVKGHVAYLVPSGHDVTERRAADRALRMLSECNNLLLRATDEISLMHDVCRLIVEVGGYSMAWVGEAQYDEAKTIKSITYAGIDSGIISKDVVLTWAENDPKGQGATGRCLRSGQVVICEDVQKDSLISACLCNLALQKGFRGGMAFPLFSNASARRVLTLASRTVFNVASDEITLLKNLADNLAYGIENLRIQQQNKRILSAVNQIADGVAVSTGMEFFQRLVLTMTAALGAHVGIITRAQVGDVCSRTVVAVQDGQLIENFDVPILGTPCEKLSAITKEWIVASEVQKEYPLAEGLATFGTEAYVGRRIEDSQGQSMGQICVLFREPLADTSYVSATLKIFTARVAAELERQEKA
ncbi:MAG: PAS domain-containing protein [Moraxellaceae bacterium]|nr:PAS domain-containing protein [Moraxellaceae bacterium]